MPDVRGRLGSSGVFKAIVMSARKLKRALSEGDVELEPAPEEFGTKIAQAFIVGRFADVHEMGTAGLKQRNQLEEFVERWRDVVRQRGPLTGFEVSNAGPIDIGFIPGLENVPREEFVAFVQIVFSSPEVPLDHEQAFAVGAVLLDSGSGIRLGAIHAR